MGNIERIYGLTMATILASFMIFCVFWALFDALFEKNFQSIGGHGSRGDMYVAPAYFE